MRSTHWKQHPLGHSRHHAVQIQHQPVLRLPHFAVRKELRPEWRKRTWLRVLDISIFSFFFFFCDCMRTFSASLCLSPDLLNFPVTLSFFACYCQFFSLSPLHSFLSLPHLSIFFCELVFFSFVVWGVSLRHSLPQRYDTHTNLLHTHAPPS